MGTRGDAVSVCFELLFFFDYYLSVFILLFVGFTESYISINFCNLLRLFFHLSVFYVSHLSVNLC